MGGPAVYERDCIVWVEMDGEIKILNRFVDFTRHLMCNGSIAVGLGIIRSQADGMIKVGDCLIVFATDKAKASAIEICGGITWVALNSLSNSPQLLCRTRQLSRIR